MDEQAELQEGGGIAWAWIADLKVYSGIQMPQRGQWWLQAAVL